MGSCFCGQSQQRQALGKYNQFLPALSLTCCRSFTNTVQRKRCSQAKVAVRASTGFGSPGCWSGCAWKHGGCWALPEEHILYTHQRTLKPRRWPTKRVPALCSLQKCKEALPDWGAYMGALVHERGLQNQNQIAATEIFKVLFTVNQLFVVWLLRVIKMGHPYQGRQMQFCQIASKCFFAERRQLLLLTSQPPLQVP